MAAAITSHARVELVSIGDELLLGETVDTNAAWLARELATRGIRVVRGATVGDDADAIRGAVSEALDRTGAVICTGGLGPTPDDRTRPVVAQLFGRALRVDDELLRALEARFAALGRAMAQNNRTQAEVPEGGTVLANAHGTAPGLLLTRDDGAFVVLLPGVPREMRGIFADALLPWLLERWPRTAGAIRHRLIRTTGIAESELAARLEPILRAVDDLGVAFLPSATGVDLRLTSWGALSDDQAAASFGRVEAQVRSIAAGWIYGTDDDDLVDALAAELRRRGWTVAVAESCTGGLVAKRLTDRAGSSEYMLGGIVAYANRAKSMLLGVAEDLMREHGAVSEAVAVAMARGATERFGADCALAVTGIAGPGGGTREKPVGTVCIAARVPAGERRLTLRLPGDREEVRERSAQAALALLWKLIGGNNG